jgi:hypothetical protein
MLENCSPRTEPWNTHPDALLAAVNAARVMPRTPVSHTAYVPDSTVPELRSYSRFSNLEP